MIEYSNIKRHDNIPFDEYLKLPGHSHSSLKNMVYGIYKPVVSTDNMRLGSLVDSILTDPASANMQDQLYSDAKDVAAKIKSEFGDLLFACDKQVSYTATASHGLFEMEVKGRLDFLLNDYAVIDLKITKSKQFTTLINYMGYKNQLWHYARMAGVKNAYILIRSVPLKKTMLYAIDCSDNYNGLWADRIIMNGTKKIKHAITN